jgi:hypothetical protein
MCLFYWLNRAIGLAAFIGVCALVTFAVYAVVR